MPTTVLWSPVPFGPRSRAPSLRKIGQLIMSRIVRFVTVKSSSSAPSTVSRHSPWQPSKTQFEIVTFLNPPFDSVPHLIRPVPPILPSASLRYHSISMRLKMFVSVVPRMLSRIT